MICAINSKMFSALLIHRVLALCSATPDALDQFRMTHGFIVGKHLNTAIVTNRDDCASRCLADIACLSFDFRPYDRLCVCNFVSSHHIGSTMYDGVCGGAL